MVLPGWALPEEIGLLERTLLPHMGLLRQTKLTLTSLVD